MNIDREQIEANMPPVALWIVKHLGDPADYMNFRMGMLGYAELRKHWPQINDRTKVTVFPSDNPAIFQAIVGDGDMFPKPRDKAGYKAAVWRTLGRLFKRPAWFRRGQYLPSVPTVTRTLESKHFGIGDYQGNFYFRAAYDCFSDTLYLRGG